MGLFHFLILILILAAAILIVVTFLSCSMKETKSEVIVIKPPQTLNFKPTNQSTFSAMYTRIYWHVNKINDDDDVHHYFFFFLQEEGEILFATHQWSPVCLTFNFFSHLFLFRVFSLFCLKFLLQSGNSNNTPRVNKTVTSNTSSLICQQERKCALVFVSIIMNDAMACIAQTFLCSLQSTQPTAC